MKILFRRSDGRLLGAQAVGLDGVDKRIDVFAMALQMGATVYDLEEAELTYAPQFGSAKSPVNFAGMVAGDVLRGEMPVAHWADEHPLLLDVRQPAELEVECVPDVVNIPLPELRARLDELPRDREIHVICRSGQRAYYATRVLLQNGFDARDDLGRDAVARQPRRRVGAGRAGYGAAADGALAPDFVVPAACATGTFTTPSSAAPRGG